MFNIKALPPIERRSDGSLPRITPQQRQAAVRLIRKVCCNYDDGNCLLLDDGEACVCVQSISYSVNCKFFRRVLLEDKAGRFNLNPTAPNIVMIVRWLFRKDKRLRTPEKGGQE